MTSFLKITVAVSVMAVAAAALPALAGEGYYHHESCYDRDSDATAGGVVTGAIVGGAVGGPAGAVVGAAVGGSAGDDSVDCRYERYDSGYYDNGYGNDGYGRDPYYDTAPAYSDNRQDYRQGYRDGFNDRTQYDYRLNGQDRGYHADGYYYRRSTYRGGYYDRYGVWHPDYEASGYGRRY